MAVRKHQIAYREPGGGFAPPCITHPEAVHTVYEKPIGVGGVSSTCWGKVCIYDHDATRGLVDTK